MAEHQGAGHLVDIGNGVSLNVTESGRPRDPGTAVVVLEPGADGGGAYGTITRDIERFATVLTYDRRGVGRSTPAQHPQTATDNAAHLAKLLDALQVEQPVVLVGWSASGLSVPLFAAEHPDKVGGVVLIDPSMTDHAAPSWPRRERVQLAVLFWFARNLAPRLYAGDRGRTAVRKQMVKVSAPGAAESPNLEAYLDSLYVSAAATSAETRVLDVSARQARAVLEQGRFPAVPAIVLHGELRRGQSAWLGAHAKQDHAWLAGQLPKGELVEVKSGSHQMSLDRPDAVVDAVRTVVAQAGYQVTDQDAVR